MNYYFEDFTESNYQYLMNKYIKVRDCIFFGDKVKAEQKSILLRHDIDVSVHRANRLAHIECDFGIKSTYFVHMNSCFYNVFEKSIYHLIKEIIMLGHRVGLHYDCEFDLEVINDKERFERDLEKNRNILSNIFEENIQSFSFHNPTEKILDKFDGFKYGGMINAYSKEIRQHFKYCSDSNGYWRYQRLVDFLEQNTSENVQVLLHPVWWTPEVMSPMSRIERAINGRSLSTKEQYINTLKLANRKNIINKDGQ